jgi:phosphoserine phosphatase
MQVILVRHGETEYNAQGRLQGYAPVPLNTRGRQQAMLVGPRVQSLRPTVLSSSDIQHRIANASRPIFAYRAGQWESVTLNDIGHLTSLA